MLFSNVRCIPCILLQPIGVGWIASSCSLSTHCLKLSHPFLIRYSLISTNLLSYNLHIHCYNPFPTRSCFISAMHIYTPLENFGAKLFQSLRQKNILSNVILRRPAAYLVFYAIFTVCQTLNSIT
jgi:hypothetical protein